MDPMQEPPPSVRGWLRSLAKRSRATCSLPPAPERFCDHREDVCCTREPRGEDDECMFRLQEPPPATMGWLGSLRRRMGEQLDKELTEKLLEASAACEEQEQLKQDPDARGTCWACGKEVFAGRNCVLTEGGVSGARGDYAHVRCWQRHLDGRRPKKNRQRWWRGPEALMAVIFVVLLILGIGALIDGAGACILVAAFIVLIGLVNTVGNRLRR